MRVVSYAHKNSGCSWHRIIVPLLLMENTEVYITNNLQVESFEKGCDVFMYNRTLPEDAMITVRELQKKYGFRIVVDVDDWWELDPHHILYEEYQRVQYARQQIDHLQNADAVFCTHERLAALIREHNSNVHILPNAIPHQGQYDIEREPYYLTRLFWQGSDTHREDINILASAVHKLAPISPKIKMVMSGYVPDHADWDHMARTYTAGLKHQYKLIPYSPVTNYYAAYAHADICLVPLVNSPFNACKSPLKVLEAANLGLPVICSDVHPYKDMPVLYARFPNDWVKHIKRLVGSRKAQKQEGARLQEWVQQHYNFTKINQHRRQVLEYISSKTTV